MRKLKCSVCGTGLGPDPRDSLEQEHCWQHVTGEREPEPDEELIVLCCLPECYAPVWKMDYCKEHWTNLDSWVGHP